MKKRESNPPLPPNTQDVDPEDSLASESINEEDSDRSSQLSDPRESDIDFIDNEGDEYDDEFDDEDYTDEEEDDASESSSLLSRSLSQYVNKDSVFYKQTHPPTQNETNDSSSSEDDSCKNIKFNIEVSPNNNEVEQQIRNDAEDGGNDEEDLVPVSNGGGGYASIDNTKSVLSAESSTKKPAPVAVTPGPSSTEKKKKKKRLVQPSILPMTMKLSKLKKARSAGGNLKTCGDNSAYGGLEPMHEETMKMYVDFQKKNEKKGRFKSIASELGRSKSSTSSSTSNKKLKKASSTSSPKKKASSTSSPTKKKKGSTTTRSEKDLVELKRLEKNARARAHRTKPKMLYLNGQQPTNTQATNYHDLCPHCRNPKPFCDELVYGEYCVARTCAYSRRHDYVSDSAITRVYRRAYTSASKFIIFRNRGQLIDEDERIPPRCMLDGSYIEALQANAWRSVLMNIERKMN